MLKPSTVKSRLDSESEKITNFFNFDRRITSIARNKAYSSARKMLVRSGSRTLLVMPLYTIAEATRSPALERRFATVIHVLIAKFVKAMLMRHGRPCYLVIAASN